MHIVTSMGTMIKIQGAMGAAIPDPSAPLDASRAFIGLVKATWTHDGPRTSMAGMVRVATGGGVPVAGWGTDVLCLRWVGDPPMPEVAQAVYDAIRDRGPAPGAMEMTVIATANSPELGSYKRAG